MKVDIRIAELSDLPEITDIYNYEVLNGVATFDVVAKSVEERKEWFYAHSTKDRPLFVAKEYNKVVGYVSLSSYRTKDAYKSTVELSIYISYEYRMQGIATELMKFIIDYAKKNESIYNIVSVITSDNIASKKIHSKFGFKFCGSIPFVARKFGKFLSIDNYSLIVK